STYSPPSETYTLSLHDALPISAVGDGNDGGRSGGARGGAALLGRRDLDAALGGAVLRHGNLRRLPGRRAADRRRRRSAARRPGRDRKSTRLNSSHVAISYAVFC